MKITQVEKDWETIAKLMGDREPLYIVLDNGKNARYRYTSESVYLCATSTVFEAIKEPDYAFVLIKKEEDE